MLKKEEILLIVYFILVIIILVGFTVLFFFTYQKRKNKILLEKFEAEQKFKSELSNAKIEIQEATLKNVSWELHDNIGQLLAIASMQLKIFKKKSCHESSLEINELQNLVDSSLTEVRALSRSLNSEVIDHKGLIASVQNEIDRFNRLEILEAKLAVTGRIFEVPPDDAIIIFRILQEFFSNTLKHSGASKLRVDFNFSEEYFEIVVADNGTGYDDEAKSNSGLLNMRSRAEIINSKFQLKSSKAGGTSLSLQYNR